MRTAPTATRPRHAARVPSFAGWAAAGVLLGALVAAVVFAPARWLAQGIHHFSSGRVLLADARGTVWSGSASVALTGGAGSRDAMVLPGRVHWSLRPLLDAGAHLSLRADCCTTDALRMTLRAGAGSASLTLADARSRWPSAWLAGLGTPWNTLQPEGALQLSTQGLVLRWAEGRLQMDGRAEVIAESVSSRLSTLRPLGSYRLTLAGGSTPALALDTLGGSLQLTGQGQWVGGRLRFEGLAQAEAQREDALGNLLNLIGQRRGAQSRITLG